MAHALSLLILMAVVVTLHQPVAAQQPIVQVDCPHLFKANGQGSLSYIEYCVSDNGNLTRINTPFDVWHMAAGDGYGLCQESPIAAYYDYSFEESGNWGVPQTLSVSGSSIKIKRSTADGNWTLVQTISKVAKTGSIKILMDLTNNQSADRIVYLLRYFGALGVRTGGASINGVWSWFTGQAGRHPGLQLVNAGKSPFEYRQGFVREGIVGPNPCDFAASTAPTGRVGPEPAFEHSLFLVYAGSVPAGATRTVTLNYRGM